MGMIQEFQQADSQRRAEIKAMAKELKAALAATEAERERTAAQELAQRRSNISAIRSEGLRPQNLFVPQRPLQRRLHLHLSELVDGEVKVLQCLCFLIWVVLQEQLSKLEAGEGQLGAEPHLSGDLYGFLIVLAGFIISLQKVGSGP